MERPHGARLGDVLFDGSLTLASGRRRVREQKKRPWPVAPLVVIAFVVLATIGASVWWLRTVEPAALPAGTQRDEIPVPITSSLSQAEPLTDEKLQRAADQLLASSDPDRPENAYFPDYVRDHLRWMVREHGAARLQVAFLTDASNGPLPPDVLMAAWKLGDKPTIFIAKPRFMRFLMETGATEPPFTQQQKNDFALALTHEIVHLRNPSADPRNAELRPAEESRVWREVSLKAVRPLRSLNQPMHRRFLDVDDALRACRDELPCAPLARLVRLGL